KAEELDVVEDLVEEGDVVERELDVAEQRAGAEEQVLRIAADRSETADREVPLDRRVVAVEVAAAQAQAQRAVVARRHVGADVAQEAVEREVAAQALAELGLGAESQPPRQIVHVPDATAFESEDERAHLAVVAGRVVAEVVTAEAGPVRVP